LGWPASRYWRRLIGANHLDLELEWTRQPAGPDLECRQI